MSSFEDLKIGDKVRVICGKGHYFDLGHEGLIVMLVPHLKLVVLSSGLTDQHLYAEQLEVINDVD